MERRRKLTCEGQGPSCWWGCQQRSCNRTGVGWAWRWFRSGPDRNGPLPCASSPRRSRPAQTSWARWTPRGPSSWGCPPWRSRTPRASTSPRGRTSPSVATHNNSSEPPRRRSCCGGATPKLAAEGGATWFRFEWWEPWRHEHDTTCTLVCFFFPLWFVLEEWMVLFT